MYRQSRCMYNTYVENPLMPCAPRAKHAARKRSNGSVEVANACFDLIWSSF